MKDLEKIVKAFANMRRLHIIQHLTKDGDASVSEVASEIRLSFKATSKHLRILSSAGILDRKQNSTTVFYFLQKPLHPITKKIVSLLPHSQPK